MQSCAFCDAFLGPPGPVSGLPGRTVAWDPSSARLWLVCPSCARWNLAAMEPAEHRAAVERLEAEYAASPHAGSGGIGVGRVKGGGRIIRVGGASWSQFAAWRYGRRLRMRRHLYVAYGMVAVPTLLFLLSDAGDRALDATPHMEWLLLGATFALAWLFSWRTRMRVRVPEGGTARVNAVHALKARVEVREDGWRLLVPTSRGIASLEGSDARRRLAVCLAVMNHRGASSRQVEQAVATLLAHGGPEAYLGFVLSPRGVGAGTHGVGKLPLAMRLALEMAANEESERQALAGEIAGARLDWRQAEETAAIADTIT